MEETTVGVTRDRAQAHSLSVRLREETREAHERVETAASFNRLVVVRLPDPVASSPRAERERLERARFEYLEVYRRFLVAAHGFETAVDAALADSPARALAESRGYLREASDPARLIRSDLERVLGARAVANLPAMKSLPAVDSLAGFVGTEYVRRGSRAGGAVIAAVVRHNLGLTRETGGSFLMQYGKATRQVITTFKDWADGLGLAGPQAREAVAAAIRTFDSTRLWHEELERSFG